MDNVIEEIVNKLNLDAVYNNQFSRKLSENDNVVRAFMDTETTGFYAYEKDRLLEIAGAIYRGRNKIFEFDYYINPERDIPIEAYNVHKISSQMVQNERLFHEVYPEIRQILIDNKVEKLIFHNAKFDASFINAECLRAKEEQRPLFNEIDVLKNEFTVIDSLRVSKLFVTEGNERNTLDALAEKYNIDLDKRAGGHNGLIDSQILAEVYFAMIDDKCFGYDFDEIQTVIKKENFKLDFDRVDADLAKKIKTIKIK